MSHKEDSSKNPLKDQIIITKKIEYEDIVSSFKLDGSIPHKPIYYQLKRIAKIAQWYEARVSNDIIKNVILTHHPRCQLSFFPRMLTHLYNKAELVPKYGATVEETYNRLKKFEKYYGQKRPKCIQSIKKYNDKNFRPIILTQIPMNFMIRHRKLRLKSDNLIQYDGSHRLLSLYYPKKINFDYVKCFIAMVDKI